MKKLAVIATCMILCGGPLLARSNRAGQDAQPTGTQTTQASNASSSSAVGHVHIYRQKRYVGAALAPSIAVDGKQIARVGSGRRVTIALTAGSYALTSDDKSSRIDLDVKPGTDYYIRVDEATGFWKGHGRLTLVEAAQGKPEYQLEKPIEQDRVVDKAIIEQDNSDTTSGNS